MEIVVDIETLAHDTAAEYVERPDLDAIQAPANLRDPVKIAEAIEKRRQDAQAEYERALSRAALDWNLSRIVAIGVHPSDHVEPSCWLAKDEAEEVDMLMKFWRLIHKGHYRIVGFCSRTFDVPSLIQRSRLLDVPHPHLNLARYGRGDVLDVKDALSFDDIRRDYIMPQSLKAFAKRFGIPHTDPTSGKDVASMVAAGDWEGVRAHNLSDVDITRELALRIGLMPTWKRQAVVA
jgi:hypothetical protein